MSQEDWDRMSIFDNQAAHTLAAFARAEGIPMSMTVPEGIRWYLRKKQVYADHAERVYWRIHRQDVPGSVQGIRDQVEAAIIATARPYVVPHGIQGAWIRGEAFADRPELLPPSMPAYGATGGRPRRYHRPALVEGRILGAGCANPLSGGSVLSDDRSDLPRASLLLPCPKCFLEAA
jgi:hypothetical protein